MRHLIFDHISKNLYFTCRIRVTLFLSPKCDSLSHVVALCRKSLQEAVNYAIYLGDTFVAFCRILSPTSSDTL